MVEPPPPRGPRSAGTSSSEALGVAVQRPERVGEPELAQSGTTPSSAASQKPARSSRRRPRPSRRTTDGAVGMLAARRVEVAAQHARAVPRAPAGAHGRQRLGLDRAVGGVRHGDGGSIRHARRERRLRPRHREQSGQRLQRRRRRATRRSGRVRPGARRVRGAQRAGDVGQPHRRAAPPSTAAASGVTSWSATTSGSRSPSAAACAASASTRRATFQVISRTMRRPGRSRGRAARASA